MDKLLVSLLISQIIINDYRIYDFSVFAFLEHYLFSTTNSIYESERWEIVPVSDFLMGKSFSLFEQMKDKEWGVVDCSSIILSRERRLSTIFTTDKHFEQAGFEILLK